PATRRGRRRPAVPYSGRSDPSPGGRRTRRPAAAPSPEPRPRPARPAPDPHPGRQPTPHPRRGPPVRPISQRRAVELLQPVTEGLGDPGSALRAPVRQPPGRPRQPIDEPIGRLQLRPAAHESVSNAEYRTLSRHHEQESDRP